MLRVADRGYLVVQQPHETNGPSGDKVLTREMQEKLGLTLVIPSEIAQHSEINSPAIPI